MTARSGAAASTRSGFLRELAERGVAQRLVGRRRAPDRAGAARSASRPVETPLRGELDLFAPGRIAALARSLGANLLHAHTGHAHTAVCARRGGLTESAGDDAARGFPGRPGFLFAGASTAPRASIHRISEGVRRVLLEGGVAPERIDTVSAACRRSRPARLAARAGAPRTGIGADEIAIVNVGALTDHKGQRGSSRPPRRSWRRTPKPDPHPRRGRTAPRAGRANSRARPGRQVVLHGFVAGRPAQAGRLRPVRLQLASGGAGHGDPRRDARRRASGRRGGRRRARVGARRPDGSADGAA